jgi:hypothetical protein
MTILGYYPPSRDLTYWIAQWQEARFSDQSPGENQYALCSFPHYFLPTSGTDRTG